MRRSDCPNLQSYLHEAMACEFAFYLHGERTRLMDTAVSEAEYLLDRLESLLSLYIENSDTNRINRAKAGEMVRIADDTVDCLLRAFDASARLKGAFHPFMGQASLSVKGQANEVGRFLQVDGASHALDEPLLGLDPDQAIVTKLVEGPLLDFGGIGKGYALDRIADLFQEWEHGTGLLESAGSTYLAMGAPGNAGGWDLDIGLEGQPIETVSLKPGQALASSGELFQGSHVIDPRDSKEEQAWSRSYAHAENAAFADAGSTAALLLNRQELGSIVADDHSISFALYSEDSDNRFGDFFVNKT